MTFAIGQLINSAIQGSINLAARGQEVLPEAIIDESSFLKEIAESFTVKTSIPLNAVVKEVLMCKQCFSQLEALWKMCPYCREKVGA